MASQSPMPATATPRPPSSTPTHAPPSSSATDLKADARSSSALRSLRSNFKYLLDPSSSTVPRPIHLRTRALLRSLRFLGVFIFWRLVRWAKYAAVGAVVAAVGATAFGGMVSGVGFLLAPPTMVGSIGLGGIWAAGKWGFRKAGFTRKAEETEVRKKEARTQGVKDDGSWRDAQGPSAMPW